MKVEYIRRKIDFLLLNNSDYGAAHAAEDRLFEEFIRYVADNGPADLSLMAVELLRLKMIDFPSGRHGKKG